MATITRKDCNASGFATASEAMAADQERGAMPAPHLWGASEVRARLAEAAEVLRALALGPRDRPARLVARWPDVVRQGFEAYGYGPVRVRPLAPSPAAVSRADAAVLWLLWLPAAARRVVWARAQRLAWRRIEDLDGRSHTTLRRVEGDAVTEICRRLNADLSPAEAVAAAFGAGEADTTKDMLTKFKK